MLEVQPGLVGRVLEGVVAGGEQLLEAPQLLLAEQQLEPGQEAGGVAWHHQGQGDGDHRGGLLAGGAGSHVLWLAGHQGQLVDGYCLLHLLHHQPLLLLLPPLLHHLHLLHSQHVGGGLLGVDLGGAGPLHVGAGRVPGEDPSLSEALPDEVWLGVEDVLGRLLDEGDDGVLVEAAPNVRPVPVLTAPLEAGLEGGEEGEVEGLGEVGGVGAEEERLDAELGAGLGHGQAGVAAGTVDEEQDGGGDAVLLDVVAQVVDDVEEGVRYIFGKTVSHDIFK